ncbi:4-phosphopantetheinyl transferase [Serratia sp. S1B]|nr:4-phosphopantetheinyl transferase [Serratia sp. S1B]
MFTLTHTPSLSLSNTAGFITTEMQGTLRDRPSVRFHQIRFDPRYYHDALFNQWNISLPEQFRTAVTKRKAEYLAGRYCAQQQLEALGIRAFELHQGEDRAPIWPTNVIGSISHHHRSAIVVTSLAENNVFLGIDTELIMKTDVAENLREMIINEQENRLMAHSGMTFRLALTLIFSLKESLYKALYPQVHKFFDCHAARVIEFSPQQGRCQLQLTESLNAVHTAGSIYQGQFIWDNQEVTTLVTGTTETP